MRNRHSKRFISVIAVVLAVVLFLSLAFSALMTLTGAANSSTIKKRINNLEAEASSLQTRKKELEDQISKKKAETSTTIEKKSQVDQQIEITRLEIQNTNDQIQEYTAMLAEKQAELDEGLRKQTKLNTMYQARIRAMEEQGTTSYWSILFKATSFSNLLDRIDMIREISDSDQVMMEQIKTTNQQIVSARKELEEERAALQKKIDELTDLQSTLDEQKRQAETLIQKLNQELGELNGTYEELDAQEAAIRANILAEEARYQEALSSEESARLKQDNSGNAAGGGSGFSCPLPVGSSRVTDAYGYRIHPIYGYYGMHSGVDLAAAHGTPVYAIASGNVNVSAYSSVNGNYVSISHGGGYGSLYAHLDYATVSAGAYVSQGEIIGYVGSTGWSSGPHLHFEIHKNGSTVNPMSYISI